MKEEKTKKERKKQDTETLYVSHTKKNNKQTYKQKLSRDETQQYFTVNI